MAFAWWMNTINWRRGVSLGHNELHNLPPFHNPSQRLREYRRRSGIGDLGVQQTCLRDRETGKLHELVDRKCPRAHELLVKGSRGLR